MPLSNREFWANRIDRNIIRDQRKYKALAELGWDVVVIWQCRLDEAVGNLITQLHEPREPIDAK